MPAHVQCADCEQRFLSFEAVGPEPIDHDACPNCGGTEFEFLE